MTSQPIRQRDSRIDCLRALGTILIILAHVNPPRTLFQIRSFDVILLVMISSMCAYRTKDINSFKDYLLYLTRRVKRLVIPAYIMITISLLVFYPLYTFVLHKPFFWTSRQIAHSYLLLNSGIGYVWITRVYLIIAAFIPFICKTHSIIKKTYFHFIVIFILIFISSALQFALSGTSLYMNIIFQSTVMYFFPYALAAFCGVLIYRSKVMNYYVIVLFISVFLFLQMFLYKSSGFSPSQYKYPPSIFYTSYGIAVSSILYYITGMIQYDNRFLIRTIEWISKRSYTIYLVHVPFLIIVKAVNRIFLPINWMESFFIVIVASFLTTGIIESLKQILLVALKKTR